MIVSRRVKGAATAFGIPRRGDLRELRQWEIDRRAGPVLRSQPDDDHHPSRPARCPPPAFGTFLIAVLGAAPLAFGVIVVSDSWSGRVHSWTAANHDSGWIFILTGTVLVLAATLPLFVSTRTVQTQEATATEREPAPAEHEPAAVSDPTAREDWRPEPAGTASQTKTETDTHEPDNTNTHPTG